MVAAVLLGNLPSSRQARVGLLIVAACATVIVYHDPTHSISDFLLIPVLFSIGWLVGFALHERAEDAQAAERRAAQAERDREVAARVAVAEERARIARELHDVVAHAVSVMVLQVGAVRHRMPPDRAEDRDALRNVEVAGRTALAEMRRLLDAMRRDDDELDLVAHPGLRDLAALVDEVRAAGLDVRLRIHGEPADLPPASVTPRSRPTSPACCRNLTFATVHKRSSSPTGAASSTPTT
jgi:signal transduction histidine kinase